jgi:hypothetical protein
MGEVEITLTLSCQEFDEYDPLPLRQGRYGAVQPVVFVTARSLFAWITLPGPVLDQMCHLRLA